jgi:DNA-binding NarL/FixJ family response regulator
MADWTDSIDSPLRPYLARLSRLERNTLRRISVLRWFDQPLYKFTQSKEKSPLQFERLIRLPVIIPLNRARPNQFIILPALREQLAANLWKLHGKEYIAVHRRAAKYFHRPLDTIDSATVSDVIEELGYLAVANPHKASTRLALFGSASLISGWAEAASRAARTVEAAPIETSGYDHLSSVARLVAALAAIFSESGSGASPAMALNAALTEIPRPSNEAEQWLVGLAHQALDRFRVAGQFQIARDRLTSREREVVLLIIRGYNNDAISRELFISSNAVKYHISSALEKLHLSTGDQLIEWASERRLMEPYYSSRRS